MIYRASHQHDLWVSLTDKEYEEAMAWGKEMFHHSQGRGLRDYISDKSKGLRAQQIGALGERGVAKGLGLSWTKWVDTFQTPDLHHNIEARLIGVDRYGLRVYEKDHQSRRVVGIVIERGAERKPYRIPGWINAKHGKRPEYLMDPEDKKHPFFGVPQEKLRDPRLLLSLIEQAAPSREEWLNQYDEQIRAR